LAASLLIVGGAEGGQGDTAERRAAGTSLGRHPPLSQSSHAFIDTTLSCNLIQTGELYENPPPV